MRVLPGAVSWPCQPHEAGALELALPEVDRPTEGTGGSAKPAATDFGEKPQRQVIHTIREAVLDSSEMAELVDAMGDILGAAGSLTLRFRIGVECAEGEHPSPEVAKAISTALAKVSKRFL